MTLREGGKHVIFLLVGAHAHFFHVLVGLQSLHLSWRLRPLSQYKAIRRHTKIVNSDFYCVDIDVYFENKEEHQKNMYKSLDHWTDTREVVSRLCGAVEGCVASQCLRDDTLRGSAWRQAWQQGRAETIGGAGAQKFKRGTWSMNLTFSFNLAPLKCCKRALRASRLKGAGAQAPSAPPTLHGPGFLSIHTATYLCNHEKLLSISDPLDIGFREYFKAISRTLMPV